MENKLEQTIIEERLKKVAKTNKTTLDAAFLAWVYSLLFDTDEGEIPEDDILEGAQEKHLDAVRVDDDSKNNTATLSFLQTKNTGGFSSNSLVLIGNGLSWVFEQPDTELAKLKNIGLRRKAREIREIMLEYGPSQLAVQVYFATRGDIAELSDEYRQEKRSSNQNGEINILNPLTSLNLIARHSSIKCDWSRARPQSKKTSQ